ncbi:MAG: FAD-binding oxidoreductase [Woeseiaceae bacterium]|nr:FAD-binding oxidoreductase [Woeseiaceae bacterium]
MSSKDHIEPATSGLLAEFRELLGDAGMQTGAEARNRTTPWETHQPCHARAVLRPSSTEQVSKIMQACFARGQSVVPYGGLTNLVQGCATTPDDIALSFERMNAIEEIDTTAHTMTVQAGVTMQAAQEAADAEGLFFPVDIGARGTCMLGGNVSSNAGGTKVIRYGMMRDSVLGLEAVLADGTVVSSMNRYIKNNSGFDLKHLFIGTEGVLGLVTRIVFRLSVKPRTHNVALVACQEYAQVLKVLNKAKALLGSSLCGFEVMWQDFFDKVTQPAGKLRSPFAERYPLYAIVEAMGTRPGKDDEDFEAVLSEMIESDMILDGVIAKSARERDEIWAIRGEVEWLVRDCYNFDVSLSVSDVGDYVERVMRGIHADIPDAIVAAFGHLGDNNIHVSVLCDGVKTRHAKTVEKHVYESLIPYRGAISAEHGIGLEKKPYLGISRSPEEIALMKSLKRSMDPKNILNPGKVISVN